jgi:hypothetical protein
MEDLKDLVVKTLDKNGSLDTIRAQLRSSVFGAIQSEQKKPIKTEANKIMETDIGQYSAELLRNFLEKSEAVHTLHVFSLESQIPSDSKTRLQKQFALTQDSVPALFKIIQDFKQTFKPSPNSLKNNSTQPEPPKLEIKSKRFEEDQSDNYTEDFEEIEEDIISQDTGGRESHRYGESGGSSGGIDPSVDSLALDQCDYYEPVRIKK